MKYQIILMRGDVYEIEVPNEVEERKRESVAYNLCKQIYPEVAFADLLDVKLVTRPNG